MTLYRFTFDRGSYDLGQAVVAADSLEEAEAKLADACAATKAGMLDQGYPTTSEYRRWAMIDVVRTDPSGGKEEPTAFDGDVVFTHGVDG